MIGVHFLKRRYWGIALLVALALIAVISNALARNRTRGNGDSATVPAPQWSAVSEEQAVTPTPLLINPQEAAADIAEIRRAVGLKTREELEAYLEKWESEWMAAPPGAEMERWKREWMKSPSDAPTAPLADKAEPANGDPQLASELRALARKLEFRGADHEDRRDFTEAERLRALIESLRQEARRHDSPTGERHNFLSPSTTHGGVI